MTISPLRMVLAALVPIMVAGSFGGAEAAVQLPNWTDVWTPDRVSAVKKWADAAPFTPEYKKKAEAVDAALQAHTALPGAVKGCHPAGFPMIMTVPLDIFVTPDRVTMISKTAEARRIYTDGRKHTPEDELFDSYSGESIGHWDGDALIADTYGMKPFNDIFPGMQFPQAHIAERIHLVAANKLADEFTITDTKALSKPWTYARTYTRQPDYVMVTDYCIPDVK
jgi:hypothetical protein